MTKSLSGGNAIGQAKLKQRSKACEMMRPMLVTTQQRASSLVFSTLVLPQDFCQALALWLCPVPTPGELLVVY
jgi:hypothetical protein